MNNLTIILFVIIGLFALVNMVFLFVYKKYTNEKIRKHILTEDEIEELGHLSFEIRELRCRAEELERETEATREIITYFCIGIIVFSVLYVLRERGII